VALLQGLANISDRSSIPLFLPLRKVLASSPLYVRVNYGNFNNFLKIDGAKEIGE
jgi:hypothetical protein